MQVNSAELTNKVPLIASALDPRHKSLPFLSPEGKAAAKLHEMPAHLDLTAETTNREAEAAGRPADEEGAVSEEDEPGSASGLLRTDQSANSSAMRLLLGDYVPTSDTGPKEEVEIYLREPSAAL